MTDSIVRFSGKPTSVQSWTGEPNRIAYDETGVRSVLQSISKPCYVVADTRRRIGVTSSGQLHTELVAGGSHVLAATPPISPTELGDPTFRETYGLQYNYMAGAMANGIASADLVIALGQAGMLGSFGAAGLTPARLEPEIRKIQAALPNGPYAFNLIHSPHEEAMERGAVELYMRMGVRVVEASAFLDLTPAVVRYRAAGLSRNPDGSIRIGNRVIAKLSRREVATPFMQPAPDRLLTPLVEQGLITAEQAELAKQVPVADDVTCEADSGGHTDNRPFLALLPTILSLRDEIQAEYNYATPVRVGVGGGIGTPSAALAAFMMGAAYIVTGSINQGVREAGASEHTKKLLAQADMADVIMAPSADMFEMGVKVQVLKRGTMFPMRAQKLYDLYAAHRSIDEIDPNERTKLEKTVFKRPMEDIWNDTVAYFQERDPEQIARAQDNPRRKMALIFRWYLGLSSRWSNIGEKGRELDYQIWCGPAMGAFNAWVRGTYLEQPENRYVTDIAQQIMNGAAYLYRLQALKMQSVGFPAAFSRYQPAQ
jgi:trans-AT polyketide synthase, acyltransferase and oxidoreductase domains